MVARLAKFDSQLADGDTAKRASAPQLIVVKSAGVHAEHVVGCSDKFFCSVKQTKQVRTAGLFFGFKYERDSREFDTLKLQVLDRKHARERSVAIVSAATTVEVLTAYDGLAGTKPLIPALHPWLLVEMAVEHDVLGAAMGRLDHVDDERDTTFGLEDLLGQSSNLQLVDVAVDKFHCLFNLAVSQKLSVVVWREVLHSDEVTESLDKPVVPLGVDVSVCCGLIDRGKILCCSFDHLK